MQQLIHRMELDLTLQTVVSGEDTMREPSLMCTFLTHIPHLTEKARYLPAIRNTRKSRGEPMHRGWEKWNKHPLHHWSFLQMEEWRTSQLISIRDLPHFLPQNGISHTVPPCPGYSAKWFSPCYALPSSVSEVSVLAVDGHTSHHLPLIWSFLNQVLIVFNYTYKVLFSNQ